MYALKLADAMLFLSTLSLRRATSCQAAPRCWQCYFYPRSPCGERQRNRCPIVLPSLISIHALLAESDFLLLRYIYNRATFLSTLSLRRATWRITQKIMINGISIHALLAESDLCMPHLEPGGQSHFYPRSPCGERLLLLIVRERARVISIHALLAESDHGDEHHHVQPDISIHALLAESDLLLIVRERARVISIHALLAESDLRIAGISASSAPFLSTLSLRRATRGTSKSIVPLNLFLSTLSLRRATKTVKSGFCKQIISIHALLAESDTNTGDRSKADVSDFYPRSPCGERLPNFTAAR